MTHTPVVPRERRTVMTGTRTEVESTIVALHETNRFIGAGEGTELADGRWKVPLVFWEPCAPDQQEVAVAHETPLDTASACHAFASPPPSRSLLVVVGVTVAGGLAVVAAVAAVLWVVANAELLVGVVAVVALAVAVLTWAGHGAGHWCPIPGCKH